MRRGGERRQGGGERARWTAGDSYVDDGGARGGGVGAWNGAADRCRRRVVAGGVAARVGTPRKGDLCGTGCRGTGSAGLTCLAAMLRCCGAHGDRDGKGAYHGRNSHQLHRPSSATIAPPLLPCSPRLPHPAAQFILQAVRLNRAHDRCPPTQPRVAHAHYPSHTAQPSTYYRRLCPHPVSAIRLFSSALQVARNARAQKPFLSHSPCKATFFPRRNCGVLITCPEEARIPVAWGHICRAITTRSQSHRPAEQTDTSAL